MQLSELILVTHSPGGIKVVHPRGRENIFIREDGEVFAPHTVDREEED